MSHLFPPQGAEACRFPGFTSIVFHIFQCETCDLTEIDAKRVKLDTERDELKKQLANAVANL
jgi:hypothetical protein